jgi:GH24 family phage-related lysozyme (muramidase)
MVMLRVGSRGEDVRKLQALLRRYDPQLRPDGVFGPQTERAVRLGQRRNGLYPPDGIAGPMTMGALTGTGAGNGYAGTARAIPSGTPTRSVAIPGTRSAAFQNAQTAASPVAVGKGDPGPLKAAVEPARERARTGTMPPGVTKPVATMTTSRAGSRFIIAHEAQRGVSNRLHHPSAGSGVTIGPGYDMKDRTPDQVERDLLAIFVPREAAAAAAKGAQLSGDAAGRFVRENKTLLNLSATQETDLLGHIIGHYEGMVKRAIKVPLHQYEFDAMVSYAYNPGGGWRKTTSLVNENKNQAAMLEIKRHVRSKGEIIRSLVVRREAESRMFLYGEYK